MSNRALAIVALGLLSPACDASSEPAEKPVEKPVEKPAEAKPTVASAPLDEGADPGGVVPSEATPDAPSDPEAAGPDPQPNAPPDPARAAGPGKGVHLVVMHAHELLGSEQRAVAKAEAQMKKAGLDVTVVDPAPPGRDAALTAWMNTIDPQARAALPSDVAVEDSAAVVAVSFRPPERRVSQNQDRLLILQRGDHPEVLWVNVSGTGVLALGDTFAGLIGLVADVEGAK